MYISQLLIDVGNNPDRPRPGRKWLGNIYHIHQRLWMGFPTEQKELEDPEFLSPFDPAGFAPPRFLFRVDNAIQDNEARAVILVQSEIRPNWEYAFQNAVKFLAAPPEVREYTPNFLAGAKLRFRIRINLSKKSKTSKEGVELFKEKGEVDGKGRKKTQGKRVGLTWDKDQNPEVVIKDWFINKSRGKGFDVRNFRLLNLGWVVGYRPKAQTRYGDDENFMRMKFRSALLEGILHVTDSEEFTKTLSVGIGSGKAFGFGLLSVARYQQRG